MWHNYVRLCLFYRKLQLGLGQQLGLPPKLFIAHLGSFVRIKLLYLERTFVILHLQVVYINAIDVNASFVGL